MIGEVFRAMGTECALTVTAGRTDERRARRALAAGREELAACEAELTRFDPRSDLSRLNANAGEWTPVGERLAAALAAALRARELTGGRFDPTILPALAAAGYDRSFERLQPRPPRTAPGWRPGAALEVDTVRRRARVARGAAADLGGIGKGWSAARALEAMRASWRGMPGALADMGGDIAVTGTPPGGGPWVVGVEDPRRMGTMLGTLAVTGGGIATSGRNRRRFGAGGRQHHLIDPATGRPASGGPLAVTVLAPQAHEAEAHATLLAIAGAGDAARHVGRHAGVAAILVGDEGEPVLLGDPPFTPVRQLRRAAR